MQFKYIMLAKYWPTTNLMLSQCNYISNAIWCWDYLTMTTALFNYLFESIDSDFITFNFEQYSKFCIDKRGEDVHLCNFSQL